ncbi:MAG: polyphosphate kinase 2 family protein [Paludisphaera borealis]|uniref:polyphosphate kinase 2 family protein n=1 Tax=Paludisphaera borealis TaxID=1387353 RepID=UPI002851DDF7|nr:polyphosphate kinase 2 family protein [Paludisphaera borealis]MDR3622331.1 polyphosphate kinase 2 family protein [Paludisphaera borealis]
MIREDIIELFRVRAGKSVDLKDYNSGWDQTEEMKELGKDALRGRARQILDQNLTDLAEAQELLYADDRHAVLIVLQAMDAAGKDGTIKHVMSGVNPQGCQVFSFKKPSAEDLDHNFLWRYMRCLPERGRIGIFNRSYYEDVLVVKVHPELLTAQRLPGDVDGKKLWRRRYQDINAFERHLVRNGTIILKFFLNVSRGEQKRRFLERLERPEKNWKFSSADLDERAHWGRYMRAYSDCLSATSTKWAPWYVVPADHKWVARAVVADVITTEIRSLDLKYPEVTDEQRALLAEAKRQLSAE